MMQANAEAQRLEQSMSNADKANSYHKAKILEYARQEEEMKRQHRLEQEALLEK